MDEPRINREEFNAALRDPAVQQRLADARKRELERFAERVAGELEARADEANFKGTEAARRGDFKRRATEHWNRAAAYQEAASLIRNSAKGEG